RATCGRRTIRRRRPAGAAGSASATMSLCEGGLEDALQFGGLIAGELAAGYLTLDQSVDLRLQFAARGFGATRLIARLVGLKRRVDIVERRRQRRLVGRTDRAGRDLRLQFVLQLLKRRFVGGIRQCRD